jgi:hypothetical protein
VPLLERPLPAAYDCAAARPVAIGRADAYDGAIGAFSPLGTPIGFAGGGLFSPSTTLARGIYASTLSADGSVATPVPVRVPDSVAFAPLLIRQGNRTTIAWIESDPSSMQIWTAQIDDTNAVVVPARSRYVAAVDSRLGGLRSARLDSDTRLFWHEYNNDLPPQGLVRAAALANDGALASTPTTVTEVTDTWLWLSDVVAFAGGYAMAYTQNGDTDTTLRYVGLDAALAPRHPVIELDAVGVSWGGQSGLLARGSEVLLAQVAVTGSYENSNIARFIVLSRYDATGVRLGGPTPLAAPVEDKELISPLLVSMGEDVGLLWSAGRVIYVCAGCRPDHALDFVVLDGASLRPKSNVVTFPSPDPGGGLVTGQLAGENGDYTLLTEVQYHVSAQLASGRLTCTPRSGS